MTIKTSTVQFVWRRGTLLSYYRTIEHSYTNRTHTQTSQTNTIARKSEGKKKKKERSQNTYLVIGLRTFIIAFSTPDTHPPAQLAKSIFNVCFASSFDYTYMACQRLFSFHHCLQCHWALKWTDNVYFGTLDANKNKICVIILQYSFLEWVRCISAIAI